MHRIENSLKTIQTKAIMGTIMANSNKMKAEPDKQTIDAYRRGCLMERNANDCYRLAEYLKANYDMRKALTFYKVNCDEYKHAMSCLEYGNIASAWNQQTNASTNMSEALRYFEKGCDLGEAASCFNSGKLLVSPMTNQSGIQRNYTKGMAYLQQSCDMNYGNACFYLAEIFMIGINNRPASQQKHDEKSSTDAQPDEFHIAPNTAKVFAYTQKACELNDWRACFNLSQLYAIGGGTVRDSNKSNFYKEKYKRLLEKEKEKNKDESA